ncbi:MAG TPA: radical SAM protein, partial [Bacteroidales bacterium]|nr:radical SAM protein [Bacteroidales bacterium]
MQNEFLKKLNTRFVFASDEFYAITGKKLPDYDEYEGFPQYENGVGMMRLFSYEIDEELKNIKGEIKVNKEYIIATGTLAYKFMKSISDKIMNKINGLNLKIVPIKNDFFGHSITVSGLVTGQDLINQLRSYDATEAIIVPKSMFKKGEEIFLDNITKEDVEKELNKKVIPLDISGKEF